ncbi:MAG: molybdopterin-dependent oxidoreductase, partial [Candidatus Hodarchaeales archaeon]
MSVFTQKHSSLATELEVSNITPNDEFFKVSIERKPFEIDLDSYRLKVIGNVHNPLNLSLTEIKRLPVTSEIVRLSCIYFKFGYFGLTGVANWTGVKLAEILSLAQINLDLAYDIVFRTSDTSEDGYSTSLQVEEAFWDDVILAYEMNEESLPADHGFPLRLVCPRFYGYKWIKWIDSINVTGQDYLGFWEQWGYNDSPYVEATPPIFYTEPTSSISISPPPIMNWFEIGIFSTVIVLGTLSLTILWKRLRKAE